MVANEKELSYLSDIFVRHFNLTEFIQHNTFQQMFSIKRYTIDNKTHTN